MKFFVDTADIKEIEELIPTGFVDGVTTNPSLIAKNGDDMAKTIKAICSIVPGPVSAEVTATDFDTSIISYYEDNDYYEPHHDKFMWTSLTWFYREPKKFTGGKFSINTSPLRGDHENSGKYKKVWISNNIEQPDEIIVTGRKETYAKDKASGTPNILIDDRPVNIQRWQAAGGYGILYQANRDSLTKVQKGLEDYAKIQRDQ